MMTTKMREYRKRCHLKQAELAEAVGVRRETIGNLERGKYNPSLKLAYDISRILGTTVDDLFTFSTSD